MEFNSWVWSGKEEKAIPISLSPQNDWAYPELYLPEEQQQRLNFSNIIDLVTKQQRTMPIAIINQGWG